MNKAFIAILGLVIFGINAPIAFADSSSDLNSAIESNNVNEVSRLLASGADVNAINSWGVTPLYVAASRNYVAIARLLIDKGANVNATSTGAVAGYTPLFAAADNGSTEVAKLLIIHGADVNFRRRGGETPLHVAAAVGDKSVAALLVVTGANINAKDDSGWTPLQRAVVGGRMDTVAFLIQKGAEVNARTNNGWTALHFAAKNGSFEPGAEDIAVLLISNGADLNAKNNEGKTPFDIASKNNPNDKDYTLLFFPVPSVTNASFNCGKATALNYVELKICSFPPLRYYDQELNKAYSAALKVGANPKEIKNQQRRWLHLRNERCNKASKSCSIGDLVKMYKRQINGLNEIANNPGMYIEM